MYFIVYKTTNLINQKIYIGIHKQKTGYSPTDFDGYYGSGLNLQRAIEKYGKNNFRRETLHIFDDLEQAKLKEKEIVNPEFILREDTYNVSEGGQGGNTTLGLTKEQKKNISEKIFRAKVSNGTLRDTEETRLKKSKSSKQRIIDRPNTIPNNLNRKHSGQALRNMKESHMKRVGTYKWITNGDLTFLHNVSNVLPEGFCYGRGADVKKFESHNQETKKKISEKIKGDVCYNNGIINLKLKNDQTPPEGFVRGMIQNHGKKIWITNGVISKILHGEQDIPDGWKRGRVV
jgi:hypothetical protein